MLEVTFLFIYLFIISFFEDLVNCIINLFYALIYQTSGWIAMVIEHVRTNMTLSNKLHRIR